MRKKINLAFCFCLLFTAAHAQDSLVPDLGQLNAAAKNTYVKSEDLDRIQHSLNWFDQHPIPPAQRPLLLETYRSVANGYALNNHFKQGYLVYQKYLTVKEKFLSDDKGEAISAINSNLAVKQHKDENELLDIGSQVTQLRTDNEDLVAKKKSFRHYFSMGIIALTAIFAFLLLQAGLKLNKIRLDLKTGREKLKSMHKVAALGKLRDGMTRSMNQLMAGLKNNIELCLEIIRQAPEKKSEMARLKKQLEELNEQLKTKN